MDEKTQQRIAKDTYDRAIADQYVRGLTTQDRVLGMLHSCGMLDTDLAKAQAIVRNNVRFSSYVVKERKATKLNTRTAPSGYVRAKSTKANVIERTQTTAAHRVDVKIRLSRKLAVMLSRYDSARTKREKKYYRSEIFKLTGLKPREIRLVSA